MSIRRSPARYIEASPPGAGKSSHHSDCGMELFTDDIMAELLDKSLETAKIDKKGGNYNSLTVPV